MSNNESFKDLFATNANQPADEMLHSYRYGVRRAWRNDGKCDKEEEKK